ncbi:MAG: ABC transporter C-terminal domain-containing protein, partial [Pyrinomonadaceae bacterium]
INIKREPLISIAKPASRPASRKSAKNKVERNSQTVEAEIAQIEKGLAAISEEMVSPTALRDRVLYKRIHQEYEEKNASLRDLYDEWDRIMGEIA